MEISKDEFDLKLQELADKNWKVKKLLDEFGDYDNLPRNIKNLIDKELGIVKIITEYTCTRLN
jgi:hypothetical protein